MCCLTKLLPCILFEKIYLYFSIGNGQPSEPALCQMYRHTFVPCCYTCRMFRSGTSVITEPCAKRLRRSKCCSGQTRVGSSRDVGLLDGPGPRSSKGIGILGVFFVPENNACQKIGLRVPQRHASGRNSEHLLI